VTAQASRTTLLAAALIAGAGTAMAQDTGVTYDLTQLPQFKGKITQYSLTPRGDVDGLILEDGTEVHFPPHLGLEVAAAMRPGETVTIHGLKAKELPLIQAISLTGDVSGRTVMDHGPRGPGRRLGPSPQQPSQPMQAQGVIKMPLHGPRGELNGALLQDGTMIHLSAPEAARLAGGLMAGQSVAVRGPGLESGVGRVIDVREFGPSMDQLTPLRTPPGEGKGPGSRPAEGPGGPRAANGARRQDTPPMTPRPDAPAPR